MTTEDHQSLGWLVVGGLHHLNGTAPITPRDPLVTVRLEAPLHATWPSNTVIVDWAQLGRLELYGRMADGGRRGPIASDGSSLFDRLLPGSDLVAAAGGDRGRAGPLVPLFYLAARPRPDGGYDVHTYSQIRFLEQDSCFIRTSVEPLCVADPDDPACVAAAVSRHRADFLFLNNHQRYYRKCFPGRELEYKYTLNPPTADIWTLNAMLYRRIQDGELTGYVPEYRDEFQAWDYVNHLFQVIGPEPDRGYVSFIPTTDGRNLMKRKWFRSDSFDRRESHTYGVLAPDGFNEYVRKNLGVDFVRLPSFRRARYDVNFESLHTGHVYGIFFDTVSLVDDPDVQLQQCELEYLRSRTVIEPDPDAVLAEMTALASWLEAFLTEHGLPATRGYYSKLSFLLDTVAAQPEPALRVP